MKRHSGEKEKKTQLKNLWIDSCRKEKSLARYGEEERGGQSPRWEWRILPGRKRCRIWEWMEGRGKKGFGWVCAVLEFTVTTIRWFVCELGWMMDKRERIHWEGRKIEHGLFCYHNYSLQYSTHHTSQVSISCPMIFLGPTRQTVLNIEGLIFYLLEIKRVNYNFTYKLWLSGKQ